MHTVRRRLLRALMLRHSPPPSYSTSSLAQGALQLLNHPPSGSLPRGTLAAPWAAIQHRGAKVIGINGLRFGWSPFEQHQLLVGIPVRNGNVIQRKGRIYQVLKAQHTQHGRGGATIQVELRDIDSGNKITERFRTDEAIERVFVQEKSFTFLYQDGDSVVLMEPGTFEQLEVSKELFGKSAAYLNEDMKVTVQYYDAKPMSASVPQRVTCTVVDAQPHTKGLTATPQYKRVSLDNGLTVLAPPFIETGDEIIVNTTDDSYITRAKE